MMTSCFVERTNRLAMIEGDKAVRCHQLLPNMADKLP